MERIIVCHDAQKWNQALLKLPDAHVLQSWDWGAFKSRHGWQAERLLWHDGAQIQAAAQILVQQRGQLRLGYVPKGPVVAWDDLPRVADVLARLEIFAREHNLILLKCDPDVSPDSVEGQAVMNLLAQRKWRPSFEQIQFRNTMLLDLRPSLNELLSAMKPKWRYNIRLAQRRGVTVREGSERDLPLLYQMYAETAHRDRFIIREEAYYLDVWQQFIRAGYATPLLAELAGEPLSMLILFHFGPQAWYMYGASRNLHRKTMPNHLLQWEAIRRAKAIGCTTYDLWGAPDTLDESDSMWGVYRFKQGFNAAFVRHIGAYDYAPHPWLYQLYAAFRPHLVKLAQWRYARSGENAASTTKAVS